MEKGRQGVAKPVLTEAINSIPGEGSAGNSFGYRGELHYRTRLE